MLTAQSWYLCFPYIKTIDIGATPFLLCDARGIGVTVMMPPNEYQHQVVLIAPPMAPLQYLVQGN